ncbi:MAG: heat-inducible transcriptional repressor HrcA [Alphaproteobacteria bacterium]|nr:heat-inducible transcriptional repressor HrcA [Alphaproteobacteria bacterium]
MTVLSEMDERAREVFRRIVETYLDTGEPVGSRTLSQGGLGVSAATVRNVMADLTDMGLLYSPHISAGRIPTEIGLRLFVDGLMQLGGLTPDERRALDIGASAGDGDTVLEQAAARLSGLTRTASLVVAPKSEGQLRHVEFVATSSAEALAILVYEDGRVENRVMALPGGLPPSSLISAGNYLSARLRGKSLGDMRKTILAELESNQAALDELTSKLVKDGVADLSDGERSSLIVRGRGRLLDAAAEEDLERVRMLFDDLERKRDVIDVLNAARDAEGVKVFIGSENRLFSLSGSSVIAAPYRDQSNQIVGVLAVLGPTRLNYARIVPIVDYTAETVSRVLGRTGGA